MRNYVITGDPGIGKTTTLEELGKLGYEIVEESARIVWRSGYDASKDLGGFQLRVLERQLELEARARGDPVFLDRGVFDCIAYCRLGNIEVPRKLQMLTREHKYGGIFILDPLPFYNIDAERKEGRELARRIHETIISVYKELGYNLERIPVLSPEERAKEIIKKVGGR